MDPDLPKKPFSVDSECGLLEKRFMLNMFGRIVVVEFIIIFA